MSSLPWLRVESHYKIWSRDTWRHSESWCGCQHPRPWSGTRCTLPPRLSTTPAPGWTGSPSRAWRCPAPTCWCRTWRGRSWALCRCHWHESYSQQWVWAGTATASCSDFSGTKSATEESGIFQRPNIYLIYHSCQKESNLHEHEVGGGVEVLQTDEWEVVVEAVEAGRHQVEAQHPPVAGDALHQRLQARAEQRNIFIDWLLIGWIYRIWFSKIIKYLTLIKYLCPLFWIMPTSTYTLMSIIIKITYNLPRCPMFIRNWYL